MSIIFIAMPQIKTYVYDSEVRNIQSKIQKVSAIIDAKSKVMQTFSNLSLQSHKNRIKDIAQVGNNILKNYYKRHKNGEFSSFRAKRLAFDEINSIRYGKNDYFYTLDNKGTLIQHPDSRFLKQNIYNRADAKGKLFVKELMSNSRKNGKAYTNYWWVRNEKNKELEKIAYTIYFKPWDIYLSTGLYIDDIQKNIELQQESILNELKNIFLPFQLKVQHKFLHPSFHI